MNLVALSILGIIIILAIMILTHNFGNYGSLALGFFSVVGLSAFLISQFKIKRELIDSITRPQIYRIIYDCHDELRKIFEQRFKKANYRSHYRQKYKFQDWQKIFSCSVGLAGLAYIVITSYVLSSSFPAANISCPTKSPNLCIGTNADDSMDGTAYIDIIQGKEGNDRMNANGGNDNMTAADGDDEINGLDGHDFMDGGNGNDNMDGGNGNDRMNGGYGSDNIDGGSGNDVLFQNNAINEPDGYMDVINCGPGNDIALFIESDRDIAADDCETTNP